MKTEKMMDLLSKKVDALYKKLVILLVISGGFGAYAIKFIQSSHWVGYLFLGTFIFVSIAIFVTYIKLNIFVKQVERISNE